MVHRACTALWVAVALVLALAPGLGVAGPPKMAPAWNVSGSGDCTALRGLRVGSQGGKPLLNNITEPLQPGECVTWVIDAAALANTSCREPAASRFLYVQLWKVNQEDGAPAPGNATRSGQAGADLRQAANSSTPFTTWAPTGSPDQPVIQDVYMVAAMGQEPALQVTSNGSVHFSPGLHVKDSAPGNGTYIDEHGMLYQRPYQRLLLPLLPQAADASSPATSEAPAGAGGGEPAATPVGRRMLAASSSPPPPASGSPDAGEGAWFIQLSNLNQLGHVLEGYALSATCLVTNGDADELPCPTPVPGAPACGGRGRCTTDSGSDGQSLESRYCSCESGWGGPACMLTVAPLPLSDGWTSLQLEPGQWAHYELQLPPVTSTPANMELLVSLERTAGDGFGGDPLLFVKPYDALGRNEPTVDAQSTDLSEYADLRSFVLQQSRHFVLKRLRGTPSSITTRYYVSIYNNQHSKLEQPAQLRLRAQLWDLEFEPLVCPLNCSSVGTCSDPFNADTLLTSDPDPARDVAMLINPQSQGFECVCQRGYGGVLCEGRQMNLSVGATAQQIAPTRLKPGGWDYYLLTLDGGFNYNQNSIGIQWNVAAPDDGPAAAVNNAFLSFDEGMYPRQMPLSNQEVVSQRGWLISYQRLLAAHNPPLPLQVLGSELTPGFTYVLSVFNSDYFTSQPFDYKLEVFVPRSAGTLMHPYLSVVLGIVAAVVLCLLLLVIKRLLERCGFLTWRHPTTAEWGEEERAQAGSRLRAVARPQGVPVEVFSSFPTFAYAGAGSLGKLHLSQTAAPAPGTADKDASSSLWSDVHYSRDQGSPDEEPAPDAPPPLAAPMSFISAAAAAAYADAMGATNGELPCCSICLCDYQDSELLRQLPCSHEFHQTCVDKWMASHDTCPICRAPLVPGGYECGDSLARSSATSDVSFMDAEVSTPASQDAGHHQHADATAGRRRVRRSSLADEIAALLALRSRLAAQRQAGGGAELEPANAPSGAATAAGSEQQEAAQVAITAASGLDQTSVHTPVAHGSTGNAEEARFVLNPLHTTSQQQV